MFSEFSIFTCFGRCGLLQVIRKLAETYIESSILKTIKKVCDGQITSIRLTYYHNVDVTSKVGPYDLISQKMLFFF